VSQLVIESVFLRRLQIRLLDQPQTMGAPVTESVNVPEGWMPSVSFAFAL
jgi:hypothetical protein